MVCVYLRFRSAKNATKPMRQATTTTAIMAVSVEASGTSEAEDAASSGSIACAAVGAGSTTKYVDAEDEPYDLEPSNSAMM